MNEQPTQNPTPSVQTEGSGANHDINIGVLVAILSAVSGWASLALKRRDQRMQDLEGSITADRAPSIWRDSAREYLQQMRDRARAEDIERIASERVEHAKHDARNKINAAKAGRIDLGSKLEELETAPFMVKLREFAEEAEQLVEQGKMRSTETVTKFQSDAKAVGDEARRVGEMRVHKASDQARNMVDNLAQNADHLMSESFQLADDKRKQASTAVQRSGRDTRSLAVWTFAAGLLVYKILLNPAQQELLRNGTMNMLREIRDMYIDAKGTTKL